MRAMALAKQKLHNLREGAEEKLAGASYGEMPGIILDYVDGVCEGLVLMYLAEASHKLIQARRSGNMEDQIREKINRLAEDMGIPLGTESKAQMDEARAAVREMLRGE